MKDFVKRDILEVCDVLGLELADMSYSDPPYLKGVCPLHDDEIPSFVIYPNSQRWVCFACAPEGGDVIDLVRGIKHCTFEQAKAIAAYELTPEEALQRSMARSTVLDGFDVELLMRRSTQVFDAPRRFDYSNAQAILKKFDDLLMDGRYMDADRLLRANGY